MILAAFYLLHGGDMDVVYFWSAVLLAAVPVAVFTIIGVLAIRGYYRRQSADGGGEPPEHGPGRRWRVVPRGGASDIHR
jgi:hypothetical protein